MRTLCQHITLHSLITFHHANTRGSSLRICASKNILSSTCHVSFLAAPDTNHQHKFSLSSTSPILQSFSYTLKTVDARSTHTLRRFTAEWWILGNPISHSTCRFTSLWRQYDAVWVFLTSDARNTCRVPAHLTTRALLNVWSLGRQGFLCTRW